MSEFFSWTLNALKELYAYHEHILPYLKMAGTTVLVIATAAIFFIILRKTSFKNLNRYIQQTIFGVSFGVLSIIATETSMSIGGGFNVNVRDAGPVVAGFIFGPHAGIIAGVIGAVERFFSVYWGGGEYTRVACSVATLLAGLFSALLRQFIFQKKRPSVFIAITTGFIIEVFHMFMILMTHLDDTEYALSVIRVCFAPMTIFVSAACGLSVLVVELISSGFRHGKTRKKTINQKVQVWGLLVIAISFILSSFFVFNVQTGNARMNAKMLLTTNIEDIQADMKKYSNDYLVKALYKSVASYERDLLPIMDNRSDPTENDRLMFESYCKYLLPEYEIAEFDVVKGSKIILSSDLDNIGFDLNTTSKGRDLLSHVNDNVPYVQEFGVSDIGGYNPSKERKFAGKKSDADEYYLVACDSEQYDGNLKTVIEELTENRHIGETGYVLITDKNWKILSDNSTKNNNYYAFNNNIIDMSAALGFSDTMADPKIMYEASLFGEDSFCMYTSYEGYRILGAITTEEIYSNRTNSIYINTMAEVLIYTILFILVVMLINILIIKRIDNINSGLKQISEGNLDTVIEEDNTVEFESLSKEINNTVDTLKKYISDAEKRYDAELELAKNIQTSALPSVFPAYPNIKNFDIFASMHTAKEIGGDFYDFYLLGETRFCFLIADVSGKGIPAALFMMQSKTMIKNYIKMGIGMGEAVTLANHELCKRNDAGMFVTAFICILDIKTGVLKFVNAGHNPPLIYRKDGEYEYLKSRPGFVLAGLDTVKYRTQKVQLNPGDKIYLYTDGVTEALNENQEMYSEERLKNVLNTLKECSPNDTLDAINNDIMSFSGDADQFDDITMLMVEFNGEMDKNIIQKKKEFPAESDELDNVIDFINTNLEEINAPAKFISQLDIAAEEIFVNIAHYAYKNSDIKNRTANIILEYNIAVSELTVTFTDEGVHFNPLEKDDPDITLSAEERQIGGLGIFLVKKIMDSVKYEYVNGQNVLMLKKKL